MSQYPGEALARKSPSILRTLDQGTPHSDTSWSHSPCVTREPPPPQSEHTCTHVHTHTHAPHILPHSCQPPAHTSLTYPAHHTASGCLTARANTALVVLFRASTCITHHQRLRLGRKTEKGNGRVGVLIESPERGFVQRVERSDTLQETLQPVPMRSLWRGLR